jgi:hypothetical protein
MMPQAAKRRAWAVRLVSRIAAWIGNTAAASSGSDRVAIQISVWAMPVDARNCREATSAMISNCSAGSGSVAMAIR